jgi:hypothetical protein
VGEGRLEGLGCVIGRIEKRWGIRNEKEVSGEKRSREKSAFLEKGTRFFWFSALSCQYSVLRRRKDFDAGGHLRRKPKARGIPHYADCVRNDGFGWRKVGRWLWGGVWEVNCVGASGVYFADRLRRRALQGR